MKTTKENCYSWLEIHGKLSDNIALSILYSEFNAVAPSKRRLAKCAPPIPSCMLFSPTMPWGSVHLSVNMVSLKYDLIRLYLFPAGTHKFNILFSLQYRNGFSRITYILEYMIYNIICGVLNINKYKKFLLAYCQMDWITTEQK